MLKIIQAGFLLLGIFCLTIQAQTEQDYLDMLAEMEAIEKLPTDTLEQHCEKLRRLYDLGVRMGKERDPDAAKFDRLCTEIPQLSKLPSGERAEKALPLLEVLADLDKQHPDRFTYLWLEKQPVFPYLQSAGLAFVAPGEYLLSKVFIESRHWFWLVVSFLMSWWIYATSVRLAYVIPGKLFGFYDPAKYHKFTGFWLLWAETSQPYMTDFICNSYHYILQSRRLR